MAWLQKQMRDHIAKSNSNDETEKTLRFSNASECSTRNENEAAMDNVYLAAEVIWRMVDRATAVEARLRDLAEGAVEKLQLADNRIQSLETERQVAEARLQEAEARIRETEEALKSAELRIADAENQRAQAELRAKAAETQAGQVHKAFILIERMEDEIRAHLLGQERGISSYQRRRHSQPEARTNVRPFLTRREASRVTR
jgi:flagellin-like hook-associated protein FlgL